MTNTPSGAIRRHIRTLAAKERDDEDLLWACWRGRP
jgi:hypothetical protein